MVNKTDRILISGASGFVGSYICRQLLQAGYSQLVGLKRKTSEMDLVEDIYERIEWLECDLLDIVELKKLMIDIEVVIHAAAIVSLVGGQDEDMIYNNKMSTANLVNLALDYKVKKFIHVSSVSALGKSKPGELISEETEWKESKFNSSYSISKKAAEMEVWRGHAEGLHVAVLNPSIILGAGYWHKTSVKIFGNMYRGQFLYPKGTNGFVDVRDVSNAVEILVKENHNGEKYLINGFNVSFKTLMEKIADVYQVRKPSFPIGDWIIPISWRVMKLYGWITRKPSVYSRSTVITTSQDWCYDNAKSKERLNLMYTPMDTTIEQVAHSFLESQREQKTYGLLPNL